VVDNGAIMEHKSFSQALSLFESLADNAPVLIWMAGPDMRCNFFNKRWLQFTGHDLGEELVKGWTANIHPQDVKQVVGAFNYAFNLHTDFSVRFRMKRWDGQYRWFLSNASPYWLPSGEFAGYISSCVDVTDSVSEVLRLEEQNYLTKTIADNATVGLFLLDSSLNCTFMNASAEMITGYGQSELVGQPISKLLHPVLKHTDLVSANVPLTSLEEVIANKEIVRDMEQNFIRKNGKELVAMCATCPIIHKDVFAGAVLEIRDITEQRAAQAEVQKNEERFKALIENSSDVVALMDPAGVCLYVSPSAQRVLGYRVDELQGKNSFRLVHPADVEFAQSEFAELLMEPNGHRTIEIRLRHRNGSWRWVEAVGSNLLTDPNIRSAVVNFRDITDRKEAQEKADYQYFHDSLTDLPNRNYFTEQMSRMLELTPNQSFGVMIVDLDRFKMINESLGHSIGDRMIQEVGLRLMNMLEENQILARLGGDEYGVLLPTIQRQEEIGHMCGRILEALKPAFRFEQHELFITPSIGISVYPNDGRDASTLLKNADSALYRAKEMGRNNFQYYNPSMNATTFQQLAMENTLRTALENKEFLVYYQPQIDIATGKIIQVEALVRWMHPDLGLTFPGEFIGIAEATGLIQPIGEWVLAKACEDTKKLHDIGYQVSVAVNMSMRQLRQRHLVRGIRRIISESGLKPEFVEFELTESVLVENSHVTYNALLQLRKDGIRFAIDDFNTGYSSLNYIKKYPIDSLKIDQSFVRGIPHQEKDTAIANSVINLAHSLGLSVTAEGVERADQIRFLADRGCNKAQGYMYRAPIPYQELVKMLENQKQRLL
jgi:diguanylate cyclase (GGDEF)-like protein/PAS domain S-box-containing protein